MREMVEAMTQDTPKRLTINPCVCGHGKDRHKVYGVCVTCTGTSSSCTQYEFDPSNTPKEELDELADAICKVRCEASQWASTGPHKKDFALAEVAHSHYSLQILSLETKYQRANGHAERRWGRICELDDRIADLQQQLKEATDLRDGYKRWWGIEVDEKHAAEERAEKAEAQSEDRRLALVHVLDMKLDVTRQLREVTQKLEKAEQQLAGMKQVGWYCAQKHWDLSGSTVFETFSFREEKKCCEKAQPVFLSPSSETEPTEGDIGVLSSPMFVTRFDNKSTSETEPQHKTWSQVKKERSASDSTPTAHERRRNEKLKDPKYRAEYKKARDEAQSASGSEINNSSMPIAASNSIPESANRKVEMFFDEVEVCPDCGGSGFVHNTAVMLGDEYVEQHCPTCSGAGEVEK